MEGAVTSTHCPSWWCTRQNRSRVPLSPRSQTMLPWHSSLGTTQGPAHQAGGPCAQQLSSWQRLGPSCRRLRLLNPAPQLAARRPQDSTTGWHPASPGGRVLWSDPGWGGVGLGSPKPVSPEHSRLSCAAALSGAWEASPVRPWEPEKSPPLTEPCHPLTRSVSIRRARTGGRTPPSRRKAFTLPAPQEQGHGPSRPRTGTWWAEQGRAR